MHALREAITEPLWWMHGAASPFTIENREPELPEMATALDHGHDICQDVRSIKPELSSDDPDVQPRPGC